MNPADPFSSSFSEVYELDELERELVLLEELEEDELSSFLIGAVSGASALER